MRWSYSSILSRLACFFSQAIPWCAIVRCAGTGNGTTTAGKMLTRITSETPSARTPLTGELTPSLRLVQSGQVHLSNIYLVITQQVDISHMFCAKPEQVSLGTSSILPSIFINFVSFLIFLTLSS